MRTATMSIAFENFARHAVEASVPAFEGLLAKTAKSSLRLAMVHPEALTIPKGRPWTLSVLSGHAWVSFEGQDFLLRKGANLAIPKLRMGAVLSVVGEEALFIEIS